MDELDARALRAFADHCERHGRPPSIRQLGELVGIDPPNNAVRVLRRLVAAGELTEEQLPTGARAFRLPRPEGVPIRGRVSCGPGVETIDEDLGRLDLGFLRGDDLVAYLAQGRSMVDAGILPGDYLIVRECPDPDPGQVVVAMVGREMVCKVYRRTRRKGVVRLLSCADGDAPAIEVDTTAAPFRVLGVLRSVVRQVRPH